MLYNDPRNGELSSIDDPGSDQMRKFFWQRKALVDARKDMYFSQLSDVTNMPKHYGKEIRLYHYVPLIDERNINDQGIDAAGVTIKVTDWFVTLPRTIAVANADKSDAVDAINDNVSGVTATAGSDGSAGTGFAEITHDGENNTIKFEDQSEAQAVIDAVPGSTLQQGSGNLYGSSKDVGTIEGKIPHLSETGGRVNRVGFTRIQRKGEIIKLGLFYEYSQDSLDFDSDDELYSHMSREAVSGAVQQSEALIQRDLLAAAGSIVYAGAATSMEEVTGEAGGIVSEVTYKNLMRLNRILNDKRTPMHTQIIAGSRMIDTRTRAAGRIMYIGSELEATLQSMENLHGEPAFVPVHQYADAAKLLTGEIGSIGHFRIISVPEMQHYAGAGAVVDDNDGYEEANGRYNVYPMLVVGDSSFTHIGFQYTGRDMKFRIIAKKPGRETADRSDPYGEMGFTSIKWWHGTLILRPERIGVIYTVARI